MTVSRRTTLPPVTTGKTWDERRNTSRTIPVQVGAHLEVLRHLTANRTQEWYQWPIAWGAGATPEVYKCRACKRWVMDGFGCRCGATR